MVTKSDFLVQTNFYRPSLDFNKQSHEHGWGDHFTTLLFSRNAILEDHLKRKNH